MSYQLQEHAPPSKVVYVDSLDRDRSLTFRDGLGLSSHFSYTFTESIPIPENIDCLLSLHSASIPYSFYNLREGVNDILEFDFGQYSGANETARESQYLSTKVTSFITIPSGNYTINTLLNQIVILLEAKCQTLGLGFAGKFLMYFLKSKQKCIFSFDPSVGASSSFKLQFRYNGTYTARSSFTTLGLRKIDTQWFAQYYDETSGEDIVVCNPDFKSDIQSATQLQQQNMFLTPNAVDMASSVRGVYIRTNLTTTSTLDTATGNFSKILSRVPIMVQTGGIIFFTPNDSVHKSKISLKEIKTIEVRLTDERNRLLDLNGLNFQIAIQFDFIYNKKVVAPLQKWESRFISHYTDRDKMAKVLEKLRNNEGTIDLVNLEKLLDDYPQLLSNDTVQEWLKENVPKIKKKKEKKNKKIN